MNDRLTKLGAALMVLPLFFLGMNLVNELRGAEGLIFEDFFLSGLGTALVVLIPASRLSRDRQPNGPMFGVTLELSRFQLLVLALALITGAVFAWYAFVENFTPRLT
jgi:hypothetical protein